MPIEDALGAADWEIGKNTAMAAPVYAPVDAGQPG